MSILDLARSEPAIPSKTPFQNYSSTRNYWTSTSDALDSSKAWKVDLRFGRTAAEYKTGLAGLLLVRDSQ